LITEESRNLPWGSSLVVISAIPTEALMGTLIGMKRFGRKVALIIIGDTGSSITSENLDIYHVSDDIPWQELESVYIRNT
jgi:3D (Asp-Asp-Asp) domain-containing protein